ncbi:adenosylcobalamin-dependent ribonucleoside-diphosphate reductase [Muricauda sp. JGD-17]|uniref:Vitamin B12-dependent ribonucleotide reductase n=1 Tax=Flagellimonas ochracea TaxID=2696472 RepID=A0A964TAN7_9FLAO|nr:adenosylcobalamin-dependent ribonucleoside-diphosphate reductase [Allomuricauda ochracea]NAY91335.1 adenosylcobalamin-dependent ribonucleoside-diphosphate reductase [Allomuricauda ochracea]
MLTENSIQILKARYLLKREDGKILETPRELFQRVAQHVTIIETKNQSQWADTFFNAMANLEFLPNSPTLMNAGLENGQLSACFVLPVEDGLSSIFETLKNAALIHQSGGGTGYNFSKLRPKGDQVSASGGVSSGPIAFLKLYDSATEHVKQGGRRRGANMGILNVDHPDIREFIYAKSKEGSLENFNISVGITDDFMQAVKDNADWNLVNPRTKKVQKTIRAVQLWDAIVKSAWHTGDPGIIFLDTINRDNPTPGQGRIESTNPCGEVPLLDYESCNLGSLNLMKVLKKEDGKPIVDWAKLESLISVAIRFLDNVISTNHYVLPQIKKRSTNNRKIGLGVMGWAELLISLGIPYDSDDAVRLGEQLMEFIKVKSYEASRALAKERGTFASWEQSIHYPHAPIRNATCNSIAPTGTISVIAGTSYSIEPLYALAFKRVGILENKTQMELNSIFVSEMKLLGLWNEKTKAKVLETGSVQHIKYIPVDVKRLFKTSMEIPWKYHLLHQKAFQKHTDNAVSKTINLPKTVSLKDVSKIYKMAWEYGLKGITIYRDGSKERQVLQKCSFEVNTVC